MDTNFYNSSTFPVVDFRSSVKENTRCRYRKLSKVKVSRNRPRWPKGFRVG